jgi:transforming growth factor-beta-induced protein
VASPDHTILLSAVSSVDGLIYTLNGLDSYTLLAPTDAAFEETVSGNLLDRLLAGEWSRHLACVLQEHVIIGPAVLLSTSITDGRTATTANNDTIVFAVTQVKNVTTISVENITISTPDLVTSDGVVHVIDGVILPDCVTKSIYDVASTAADFSTLKSLVDLAGLNETLSTGNGLTLFAPTNAAFALLDPQLLAVLKGNVTLLTSVLTYHVLDGVRALEGDLLDEGTVATLEGSSLTFVLTATNVLTVNGITIADQEVLVSNGVIYIIDTVLSESQNTIAPV